MNRLISSLAVALVVGLPYVAAQRLDAQEQAGTYSDEARALRAVVEWARQEYVAQGSLEPGGTIAITPERIAVVAKSGQRIRILPGRLVEPGILNPLTQTTGATVAELANVRSCATRNPRTCQLTGAQVVLSVGELTRTDTGATMVVRVFHHVPTDSRQPVHRAVIRLEMTKQGSGWAVASKTMLMIS